MNLTRPMQDKLRAPVFNFEVALRSYVADKLLDKYHDNTTLKTELEIRSNERNPGVILGGKISSAKKFSHSKEGNLFWENLNFSRECCDAQKQLGNHDVLTLGDTVLMFYIFSDILIDSSLPLKNKLDFLSRLEQYHDVRNRLSHPASFEISENDASDVIGFMLDTGKKYNSAYFWYRSFHDIKDDIIKFKSNLPDHALENVASEKVFLPILTTNFDRCETDEQGNIFWFTLRNDGYGPALDIDILTDTVTNNGVEWPVIYKNETTGVFYTLYDIGDAVRAHRPLTFGCSDYFALREHLNPSIPYLPSHDVTIRFAYKDADGKDHEQECKHRIGIWKNYTGAWIDK